MFSHKINLTNFVFEITRKCNHNCMYCYNVWKCPNTNYPAGPELSTEQIKSILCKLKSATKIKYLAISGGEPLLRDDTPEIIKFCLKQNIDANLLTNGSLLTPENCKKCVDAKTAIFEVPFLTTDEKTHAQLTGNNDYQEIVRGIKNLKKYKVKLVTVFVATKLNINQIKETVETAIALGTDGIMFNRFNAGGEGINHIAELTPSLESIKKALAILDDLAGYYGVGASVSVPIPRCLINPKEYKHVSFGHCPSGDAKSYYTIDASGNIRICNHTPTIIGNLLNQDFKDIISHPFIKEFQSAYPKYCKNCKELTSCWGGCKASAQVCRGNIKELEPFLSANL